MIKFPPVIFPVAFSVPATLTPVPVAIIIFALPATDVVILPLAVDIDTLLVPLAILLLPPDPPVIATVATPLTLDTVTAEPVKLIVVVATILEPSSCTVMFVLLLVTPISPT